MSVFTVPLNRGRNGPHWAYLREPTGAEELSFTQPSPLLATELLARLLVSEPGGEHPSADAWSLTVSERDRLIAELYRRCYGDQIEARVPCRECGVPFSLSFSLGELLSDQRATKVEGVEGPDEQGVYRYVDGVAFRLPTAADERLAAHRKGESLAKLLLERCVVEGGDEKALARVERAVERLAPLLSVDLEMVCPECQSEQTVVFDLVSFFIMALGRERDLLLREIHCLAGAYRWSHAEILALPRSERRAYVALVLAERAPEGESVLS